MVEDVFWDYTFEGEMNGKPQKMNEYSFWKMKYEDSVKIVVCQFLFTGEGEVKSERRKRV